MAKDRITDQTIVADFSDGDILYGEDVNKIIEVFKEGINKNKSDLNRILTGSEYFFIADDLSGLTALLSEETPLDGQRGYVFNNKEAEGSLEVYVYNGETMVWEFLKSRLGLDLFEDYDILIGSTRVFTTTGPLEGHRIIDGVTLEEGNKVLVAGQGSLNGVYIAKEGEWFRISEVKPNQVISIDEGNEYGGSMQKILENGEIITVKKPEQPKLQWEIY